MEKLIMVGIGLVGSLISGKIQKKIMPGGDNSKRDTIPTNNGAGAGIGVGAITGDPIDALAAMIGSLLATYLHQAAKWAKERKAANG